MWVQTEMQTENNCRRKAEILHIDPPMAMDMLHQKFHLLFKATTFWILQIIYKWLIKHTVRKESAFASSVRQNITVLADF